MAFAVGYDIYDIIHQYYRATVTLAIASGIHSTGKLRFQKTTYTHIPNMHNHDVS
ncbi:hypothetical protein [Nostoc sp. 'Peltigera membranacea cyanobiont' 210A]|uniref:hypothetical protein n=1 Tax=Nostoc sp. 'Peltigera membranacea cyanobiont' 210A TaxID=2014529 RepID=UPI00167C77A9|nr:hypothetical protein [Nostoc sp. 'Peltigera membranacea cyanobiont' 210A]